MHSLSLGDPCHCVIQDLQMLMQAQDVPEEINLIRRLSRDPAIAHTEYVEVTIEHSLKITVAVIVPKSSN